MKRAAILVVLLAGIVSAQANLLSNPGFETAGTTSTVATSWTTYEGAERVSWAAQTGDAGMALTAFNVGWWGGAYQNVAVNLLSGNVFTYSIFALAEEGFSSSADELFIKLEFKDSSDAELYNVQESIYTAATADPNNWNQYTMAYTNSNVDVASVTVVFGSGQWDGASGNRAVKFDNADFLQSAVPEPVSATLLGLGIVAIYAVRRKMRK